MALLLDQAYELVDIDHLLPHPDNPRKGNVDLIAESVEANGFYGALVVQRSTGFVLAGNHRLLAARRTGLSQLPVTWVDVDDERARRILLVDNRANDLASYDDGALAALLSGLPDMAGTGYTDADLEALLGGNAPAPAGSGDPDGAPETPVQPVSVLGDLWLLGPHRLLCGDSDDVTNHDRLLAGQRPAMVYTDPPYGMSLQTDYTKVGHGQGKSYEPVIGDDQPYDAGPLVALYDDVPEQFWWGADYYRRTLPDGGSWIVWDKRDNDQDMDLDSLFGAAFELCWSRRKHKREIARVLWAMSHGSQRPGEDARRGLHPTQKPTALVRWFFERWGKSGDVVADFYGGSGTTVIACEQAGRVARVMELDPRYVDVIARRYQEHTGTLPVLEATGEPHDFTG